MLALPDPVHHTLHQLAAASDCLIFGELHGTQEVPQLLGRLLDDLTELGYGGLALEISRSEQEAIRRWATGASEVVPPFFARPSPDGRGNEQALALIRAAAAKGWQLLCFSISADQACPDWQSRDRTMAENLTLQWEQDCPGQKIVGVCGNLHSRLAPLTGPMADMWPSFAACFREHHPQCVLRTVAVVFHGGAIFNMGVRALHGDMAPIAEAEVREDATGGHSLELHLPQATPATFLAAPSA